MHLYICIQQQGPRRMWQYSKENQSQVTKPSTKDLASHLEITLPNSKVGVSGFQSPASIQVRLFGEVEVTSVSGRENWCKQWYLYSAVILGYTVKGSLQVRGYGRKISLLENTTFPFFSPAPQGLSISTLFQSQFLSYAQFLTPGEC